MTGLVIETGTERGVVGLFREGQKLWSASLPFGLKSSSSLLPRMEEGFAEAGLSPKDLDYVAVGVGPGSYTGVRLGVMVAKTMAFACRCPIIRLGSLEGFIPCVGGDGLFAVVVDARISGVYLLIGEKKGAEIHYCSTASPVPLDQLGEKIGGIRQIVTPCSSKLREKLDRLYPENQWQWEESSPNIDRLGRLACGKFAAGDFLQGVDFDISYATGEWTKTEKPS